MTDEDGDGDDVDDDNDGNHGRDGNCPMGIGMGMVPGVALHNCI